MCGNNSLHVRLPVLAKLINTSGITAPSLTGYSLVVQKPFLYNPESELKKICVRKKGEKKRIYQDTIF